MGVLALVPIFANASLEFSALVEFGVVAVVPSFARAVDVLSGSVLGILSTMLHTRLR